MCDYSLESVLSRPAKVGDRLTTRLFRTSTRGFSAPENEHVAVCLLPGTELSFANAVKRIRLWPWNSGTIQRKTAIFREINQGIPRAHHDALEFPDGQIVLLTLLQEGQQATVLQLPPALERAKAVALRHAVINRNASASTEIRFDRRHTGLGRPLVRCSSMILAS